MNRKIRTWVEISLNNLEHNYREISSRLPDGCQHGVHVIDPHIRNPVNVNFCVRHEPLEIFKIEVSAKRGFGLFV